MGILRAPSAGITAKVTSKIFGDRRELSSRTGRNVITDVFILRGPAVAVLQRGQGAVPRLFRILAHVPGGFFLYGVVACRDGRQP